MHYVSIMANVGEIEINDYEDIDDLKMMFDILAKEMQLWQEDQPDEDDTTLYRYDFILAILCKFSWPGKTSSYSDELKDFLVNNFRGIATDINLQQKFRASLSPDLIAARDDYKLDSLRRVFRLDTGVGFISRDK